MSLTVNNTVNMAAAKLKIHTALSLYGKTAASQLEASAKREAPWIDRTTNARNSIQGKFKWEGDRAVVELSGNMDYFVYLELAMGKRYAILVPTIQRHGPGIVSGFKRVIG